MFAVNFILLQDHSTCFGCCPHPSSGVHKTAVWTAFQTWPRWKKVAAPITWPVLEAVVTVLCTPDDGCGQHPKHVQWSCSKIKLTANSCIALVYYNMYEFIYYYTYRVGEKCLTYLNSSYRYLTPWSRVLLEKLTVSQLVKKFPIFYGTQRLITPFTRVHHLSLSWAL